MKCFCKNLFLILILVFLAGACHAMDTIFAYWVIGTIPDLSSSVKADGRDIVLYRDQNDLDNKTFVKGKVVGNQFILNVFSFWPIIIKADDILKAATVRKSDGYGASGSVIITGLGWDEVKNMALSKDGGIPDPGEPIVPTLTQEPSPEIKVWFGNRVYQKAMVEKGEQFIVSKKPRTKIVINIPAPYALDNHMEGYAISVDSGTPNAKSYSIQSSQITQKISAMEAPSYYKSLTIEYPIPDELSEGSHTIKFSARSAGTAGIASSSIYEAIVTVKSGPVSIIGEPIAYPSPFSPTKNMNGVEIQYTLSDDASIDIYIFSVSGEIVKKISCMAGFEGGSAGLNKVRWDGRMDAGGLVGNGIYVTTFVSKSEGKLLKKFKLNIFD